MRYTSKLNINLLSSSFLSVNISQERNLRDSLCKSGQKGRVTKHARVIFSWTKKSEDHQKQTQVKSGSRFGWQQSSSQQSSGLRSPGQFSRYEVLTLKDEHSELDLVFSSLPKCFHLMIPTLFWRKFLSLGRSYYSPIQW